MDERHAIEVEAVLHDFLRDFLQDLQSHPTVPPVEDYLPRFPGHEAIIRRKYEEVLETEDVSSNSGSALERETDGQPFGHFDILGELGRGGQGRVFVARDSKLGRRVALKILTKDPWVSPEARARFQREAEAASRIDHPSVCTVFETGEIDGVLYISMRYIDGVSLAASIDRERESNLENSPPASSSPYDVDLLNRFEKVARALDAVHREGLLHRDIKPSNIVVSREGEPVLVDFGLVRETRAEKSPWTRSGDLLGTPLYLAPELLDETSSFDDPRSDIYSLGVTFYEYATRCPPFEAATREGLYRAILEDPVPDARNSNPELRKELSWILQTAMARDPDRRYSSAAALAEDLARLRHDLPIRARPPSAWMRTRLWLRRHPRLSVAVCGLLAVLLLGSTTSLFVAEALYEKNQSLELGNQQLREARDGLAENLRIQQARQLASDSVEIAPRDSRASLRLALQGANLHPDRETLSRLQTAVFAAHERSRLRHQGLIVEARFTDDGQRILTASHDRSARLWTLDGEEVIRFEHESPILAACLWRDFVVTGLEDHSLWLWDLEGDPWDCLEEHEGAIVHVESSPSGGLLLSAGEDGVVRLWDPEGMCVATLEGSDSPLLHATFSPDESAILTGSEDGMAALWENDGAGWRLSHHWQAHTDRVFSGSFSPDSKSVLTYSSGGLTRISRDSVARLWHRGTGSLQCELPHRGTIFNAEFTDDGHILSASRDGSLHRWDGLGGHIVVRHHLDEGFRFIHSSSTNGFYLTGGDNGLVRVLAPTGATKAKLRGHLDDVYDGAVSSDDRTVLTVGTDHRVKVWRLHPDDWPALFAHQAAVVGLDVATPSGRIATASYDGTLRAWSQDGVLQKTFPDQVRFSSVDLSPSGGHLVATAPTHNMVRSWDLHFDEILELYIEEPFDALFSPDATKILVAATGGATLFTSAGQWVRTIGNEPVSAIAFSPEGTEIATAHPTGHVCVFDLENDAPTHEFRAHATVIKSLVFSPDGATLLSGSSDRSAAIFDRHGQKLASFDGHDGKVFHAIFSEDGSRVFTASGDGVARMWSPGGELLMSFAGHATAITRLALSKPYGALITASADSTVRYWPLSKEKLLHLATRRGHFGENSTQ